VFFFGVNKLLRLRSSPAVSSPVTGADFEETRDALTEKPVKQMIPFVHVGMEYGMRLETDRRRCERVLVRQLYVHAVHGTCGRKKTSRTNDCRSRAEKQLKRNPRGKVLQTGIWAGGQPANGNSSQRQRSRISKTNASISTEPLAQKPSDDANTHCSNTLVESFLRPKECHVEVLRGSWEREYEIISKRTAIYLYAQTRSSERQIVRPSNLRTIRYFCTRG